MKNKSEFILYIILSLNVCMLLFPSNFKFIPILLLGVFALKSFAFYKKFNLKFFILSSIPYLILVFGMLYTTDLNYGIKRLETGASLMLYPFCFSLIPSKLIKKQLDKNINRILSFFVISIVVFVLGIFLYFVIQEGRSLIYIVHHFNILIDKHLNPKYQIHSIYLAFLNGLSFIFSVWILFNRTDKIDLFVSITNIVLSIFFLSMMNKRMAIIGLIVVGVFVFFVNFKSIKNKFLFLLAGGVMLCLIILSIILMPRFRQNNSFKEFSNFTATIKDSNTSIGKRVHIYKNVFDMFSERPIFGYGTGDGNHELSNRVLNSGENINTHNQFLSYLIYTGLFGAVVFMLYVLFLFKASLFKRDMLFFCVLLFFVLNMLTENILERETGVVFFAFWCNLLLYKNFRDAERI